MYFFATRAQLSPLIYLLIVRRSLRGSIQDIKLQENQDSYTRFLEGEIEKERKRKGRKHTSVRIRDRGISSSSKIGNQCGFTDGAFVRDRQLDKVRCDTPWVITLSYCAVLKCVGASRCWLGGCYCGCCCCCSCVFVLRYRPDYRLQSCSFFFFSFSFNPFNAAIIEAYRDKSLIAMLSFSFSPHPLYIRFSSILFRDNR